MRRRGLWRSRMVSTSPHVPHTRILTHRIAYDVLSDATVRAGVYAELCQVIQLAYLRNVKSTTDMARCAHRSFVSAVHGLTPHFRKDSRPTRAVSNITRTPSICSPTSSAEVCILPTLFDPRVNVEHATGGHGHQQVRRGPTSLTEFEVTLADMYVALAIAARAHR